MIVWGRRAGFGLWLCYTPCHCLDPSGSLGACEGQGLKGDLAGEREWFEVTQEL